MIVNPIERKISEVIRHSVTWLETRFKQWTRPAVSHQVIGTLADLKRSKSELIAENMFLRQQLIVLERQVVRPKMTQRDRQVLVLLASQRLEGSLDRREAGHLARLAPIGLQVVLATKITRQAGQATDLGGDDCADRRNGDPQSNLACQTDSG